MPARAPMSGPTSPESAMNVWIRSKPRARTSFASRRRRTCVHGRERGPSSSDRWGQGNGFSGSHGEWCVTQSSAVHRGGRFAISARSCPSVPPWGCQYESTR